MLKAGSEFEGFVHYVYESIIRLEDRNTIISKNAVIIGRSGVKHEFDVFYEFTKANALHKVAIECKDYNVPISKGKVTEFHGKINDVNNVTGVMVTKVGYQSGAKDYAEHYGISILTIDDLPNLMQILSLQLKQAFLPNETIIGQPFWTLMETINGEITGTYTCAPSHSSIKQIPLFYSKRVAQKFLSLMDDKNSVVRGVNQQQLKAIITFLETSKKHKINNDADVVILPLEPINDHEWIALPISLEELKRDYVLI
ncbi:Restriction endonuclease [compost metagenome]